MFQFRDRRLPIESWIHSNREEAHKSALTELKLSPHPPTPNRDLIFFNMWIKLTNLLLTFCWKNTFVDGEFNISSKLKFSMVTLHHPSRYSTTFLKPTINPTPCYHIIRSSLFLNMGNSMINEKFNLIINPYRFKRLACSPAVYFLFSLQLFLERRGLI